MASAETKRQKGASGGGWGGDASGTMPASRSTIEQLFGRYSNVAPRSEPSSKAPSTRSCNGTRSAKTWPLSSPVGSPSTSPSRPEIIPWSWVRACLRDGWHQGKYSDGLPPLRMEVGVREPRGCRGDNTGRAGGERAGTSWDSERKGGGRGRLGAHLARPAKRGMADEHG